MTDPYQQPCYQPPGDIQGADARAYEERIASLLRGALIPSGPGRYQVVAVELVGKRPDTLIVICSTQSGREGVQAVGLALWASAWATDGAVEIDGRLHDAESLVGWIIRRGSPAHSMQQRLTSCGEATPKHKDRAASRLKISLGQHQRLIDPQPRPPKDHDERAHPRAVQARARGTHHGDDLLYPRWISGKASAFIALHAPAPIPGHRRWRATPTGRVEQLD